MIIAILGSGGREHAICKSISLSKKVNKIFCVPGNGGTEEIAENIDIKLSDFSKLINFFKKNKVDLVIIGPEQPLVDGLVDYLNEKIIFQTAHTLNQLLNNLHHLSDGILQALTLKN